MPNWLARLSFHKALFRTQSNQDGDYDGRILESRLSGFSGTNISLLLGVEHQYQRVILFCTNPAIRSRLVTQMCPLEEHIRNRQKADRDQTMRREFNQASREAAEAQGLGFLAPTPTLPPPPKRPGFFARMFSHDLKRQWETSVDSYRDSIQQHEISPHYQVLPESSFTTFDERDRTDLEKRYILIGLRGSVTRYLFLERLLDALSDDLAFSRANKSVFYDSNVLLQRGEIVFRPEYCGFRGDDPTGSHGMGGGDQYKDIAMAISSGEMGRDLTQMAQEAWDALYPPMYETCEYIISTLFAKILTGTHTSSGMGDAKSRSESHS